MNRRCINFFAESFCLTVPFGIEIFDELKKGYHAFSQKI